MRIALRLLSALALVACVAAADTLTPSDTLIVDFTTYPSTFGGATPNVLVLGLGMGVSAVGPAFTVTTNLYDGLSLLGTYSYPSTELATRRPWWDALFKSPTSPWSGYGRAPQLIDFTSILDGTIQGRMETTIDGGEITGLDLSDCNAGCDFGPVFLALWESTTPGGASGKGEWRTFDASIIGSGVPEPATVLLVIPALAMLLLRRRVL